jgi:hypothetical protein
MTLSNLEYYTIVGFSSMKSLTLCKWGYDKCVIKLQPEVFLGTNPMVELLKLVWIDMIYGNWDTVLST